MAEFHCRLCDCTDSSTDIKRDAKSGESLSISVCSGCGLVQQTSMPSDEDLRIYYSHNYRKDYKKTYYPKAKYVRRAGIAALDRLRFMKGLVDPADSPKLLDIGAGGGEFVYMASRAGFEASGIEPNEGYSEFAKEEYGKDIRTMGIDDLESSSVDVVTLFHVFEHLAHPLSAMAKISSSIKDGGLLFVEVPNILQADASPHNIYFKAHLFYYSRPTLEAAADRWFETVSVDDTGNLRMLFRKRETEKPRSALPQSAAAETRQRLSEKGWVEYLFEGGGFLKPFGKLKRSIEERSVRDRKPREILDGLFARSGQ